ncbi:MAG: TonB-dependent receptor [Steroidobacteraceae bacterium]|jgi:TonB-dependent receptor|nr:TonB-dependent receptor [Steroidobacteraceae bacterium]
MRNSSRQRKFGHSDFINGLAALAISVTANTAWSQAADQSAEKPATSAEEIETVLVSGTRQSLKTGIERKRAAGTVSDSIVAEDIAQFPDKNIGEALSRVTGVQLSRDFGEGVAISIRGVDPALNRVEINGMSVISAGGPGSNQRQADFRELASELIKTVDVIKGSTADITEGGIGGTVKIELRKPLELAEPLFSVSAEAQELTTMGGWTPRANLTAATQLFDGRFGVIANVTYDEVNTRQDYLRNTEWVRLGDWDESPEKTIESQNAAFAAQTTEAGCVAAFTVQADRDLCRQQWWDYSPRIPRYGIWYRNEKRSSAQLTLEYKINENQNVWVETALAKRDQFLNDHNFGTDFTGVNRVSTVTNNVYDSLAANSNVTVVDHHVVGYTVANTAPGNDAAFGTSSRGFDLENETRWTSAGYKYSSEKFEATLGSSIAESDRFDETNSANFTARIPGFGVQLDSQGVPHFNFPAGLTMDDDNVYYTMQLQYRPSESELEERNHTLDLDFKTDWPVISSFETGVQIRDTSSLFYGGGGFLDRATGLNVPSKNINLTANLAPGTQPNTVTSGTGINAHFLTYAWNTATFLDALGRDGPSPGTFYGGYDAPAGIPSGWRVPVFDDLAEIFDVSQFNHEGVREAVVNGTLIKQIPGHDITEDASAQYFKVNVDTELFGIRMRGNAGVRQVRTETSAAGVYTHRIRQLAPTPTNPANFTDITVGNAYVAIDREYTDTLPSANLQLEIKENFNIRLGFAELMSRPSIQDIAPAANCLIDTRPDFSGDTDADDCTAGNPALKPYRAKSYDLEFAYYPTDEVEMRLGGFYKDIDTFIVGRTLVRDVDFFGNGTLFDVTMPINGAGAKTQGIEASVQAPFTFLPGWASGFGGLANYTFSEAKDVGLFSQLDGSPLPFPGLSKDTFNLVLYYDKGPVNARVAWNSRTDWLASAADRSGNPVFRAGEDYLDAKFTWRIKPEELSIYVEAKNLTDQAAISYAGNRFRLSELGWPGRRYYIGVNWKPIR